MAPIGFSRMIGTIGLSVVTLGPTSAFAADETYRTRNGLDWANIQPPPNNTWEVFRSNEWVAVTQAVDTPNAGDAVTIRDGHTVTVTDAQSVTDIIIDASSGSGGGRLDIGNNGHLSVLGTGAVTTINRSQGLRVLSGGKLAIEVDTLINTTNASGTALVSSGGVLELHGEGALTVNLDLPLAISGALRISETGVEIINDSTMTWSGATLEIGPNSGSGTITYTNTDTMQGVVTIKRNPVNASGVAVFANDGQVIASGGSIVLDSSLSSITDTAAASCLAPRWVASSGGTLQFNRSATSLVGYFSVAGTLRVNDDVDTDGNLKITGGCVEVDEGAGATFNAAAMCSGSCSIGGLPVTADACCLD